MTQTRNRSVGIGVSAALLLVLAGCDGGLMGVDTGNVRFVLMGEAPAATLETASQPDAPHASLEPARSGEHDHDRDHRPWRAFVSANVTFSQTAAP